MSSTENPGDQTPQADPVAEPTPEGAAQATTGDAPTADLTGAGTAALRSETESAAPSATGPATPPEADATAEPGTPAASSAVTPDAGTPAAPAPSDAVLADPTDQAPTEQAPTDQAPTDAPAGEPPAIETPAIETPAIEVAGETPDVAIPDVTADEAPPAAHPVPTPHPMPRPPAVPAHPVPSPSGSAPVAAAPAEAAPAEPSSDPTLWGRVDEEGAVYVRTADGERAVGNWQAGEPAAGLAHYGRRYDDLATEVALLEARLAAHTGNPNEIRAKAQALAESVPTADVVGDLPGLAARLGTILNTADAAVALSRAEKAAARALQVQRKEALAVEAEQIAADATQWKAAGDRLKAIVEEWKAIKGIDRKTDDALWQRFAAARDAFGRRRGAHFASLDSQRTEARAAKTELITEAERLSGSTEWGPTSAAMRTLMDRWKAVPRIGRDTDDDLWKRFRAAQDVFFAARTANDQQRTGEEQSNQREKEELLAQAEKIQPGKDLRTAQNALRKIQERYDAIGHVPRGVMRELEDRMRAVEEKARGAADSTRARVAPENPLLTSMRAAVTKAEDQLAKAEASGDAKRVSEARANLSTRREWLTEAEKSSSRR